MSHRRSSPVQYKCLNDCERSGCPGHEVVLDHNLSSDFYEFVFYTAGKEFSREVFDENRFHAMLEAFRPRKDERERCAKIAEAIIAEREDRHKSFSADESWQWAINEMSEEVNTAWCQSDALILDMPARIRSGK